MQHSSVRFAPSRNTTIIETSQKKPCQAVKNSARSASLDRSISDATTNSAPLESQPQHFAVAKSRRIGYFESTPDFQERAERAKKEAMKVAPEQLRIKTVSDALDLWWEHVKEPSVRKPRTKEAYLLYMGHLKRKIGAVILCEVNIGYVLEYQRERHKVEGASTWLTNHETNTLSQVMRYADLWDRIEKYFRQLPPPDWTPPKVMTVEEEEFFFKIAAANPEWEVTYWGCSLSNNTSAIGCELIHLQKKHIIISHDPNIPSVMHVPDGKVKNEFRARVIPLNEVALKQVLRIVERAEKLAIKQGFGCLGPEHYIFPRGVARNRFDVTKPASRYFMEDCLLDEGEQSCHSLLRKPHPRSDNRPKIYPRLPKAKRMTIVIGKLQSLSRVENEGERLVTETGLVMAADTEETAEDFKRSVSKLEQFKNPSGSLIIGGAGPQAQIETITQLLQEKFKAWDNKDPDKLQESFKKTIKEHYQAHVLSWPTMAERQDNDFSLLIGLALPAFDDLRLLVSQKGMLRREKRHAAIGTGANYAYDLMEDNLFQFGGTISVAVLAAIYVIYRVKRNTPFCGKDTHVWQIVERARRISDDIIEKAEAIFKRFDDFLSGQLFVALRAGDTGDYKTGFDDDNVVGVFRELREEIRGLITEMENR